MFEVLKGVLESKVGFSLTSFRSCRKLEEKLFNQGIYISYSTLARTFGVGNDARTPRLSTLDQLSFFLGYQNFEDFQQKKAVSNDTLEKYTALVLELKSELAFGDSLRAMKLFIEIRKNYQPMSEMLSQEIALYLFGGSKRKTKELEFLLKNGIEHTSFIDHFVYEDDPYCHYEWFLDQAVLANLLNENKTFALLFLQKKRLLRNDKNSLVCIEPIGTTLDSIHLYSRHKELLILSDLTMKKKKVDREKYFLEVLSDLQSEIRSLSTNERIILMGRICRATFYSHQMHLFKQFNGLKLAGIEIINSTITDLEFQAPIYACLKEDKTLDLNLNFYYSSHWKNAQLESEMILSYALGLKKAHQKFQKGMNLMRFS